MRVLIIEDELPAARQLAKMLAQQIPEMELVDTLDSVEAAIKWFSAFDQPDLVFMDIQIADGLSFEILRRAEVRAPVIFTTAFDQYAVQAFKVNAVDYLLKPIDPDELATSLQKVKSAQSSDRMGNLDTLLRYLEKGQQHKDRFLVKAGQQFIMVPTVEIAYFRSSDSLTMAHTLAGKKHFLEYTLDELENLLPPSAFFRINRSTFVSVNAIKGIFPHLNGRLKLDLSPTLAEEVYVSRERVPDFKVWLGA